MPDDKKNSEQLVELSAIALRFRNQIDKNTFTCSAEGDSTPNKLFTNQIGNNTPTNETTKPVATPPNNDKSDKK